MKYNIELKAIFMLTLSVVYTSPVVKRQWLKATYNI